MSVQLRAGDRIDHYTLVKPLGEGGQGSVWEVVDPRAGGVTRALKLVRLEETGRAGFDRARREAKILAAAKHPALVHCHGLFEDLGEGVVGVVMDLVPGCSLADAVADGRIDPARCFGALEQIAAALAYLHGAGLAHRDLKPDNVLLADGFWQSPHRPGFVKLVDFGIAAPASNPRPLTSVGAVVGTLPYMSPELVDPATWGKAEGPARDLFAFGVTAWEILFRKHPTGLSPSASMIDFARAYKAAQVGRIPWPPRGLEGTWGAAIGACLALRPGDRPANGAALCAMLRDEVAPVVRASVPSAVTTPHRAPTQIATAPARPPRGALNTFIGWMAVALVVLATAIAVVFASAAMDWWESKLRLRPAPTPPPYVPPATTPAATAPQQAAATQFSQCCRPEAACTGPTRFACPRCDGKARFLDAEDRWSLRVAGAQQGSDDLTMTRPRAQVCATLVRAPGPPLCTKLTDVARGGSDAGRIQVNTRDVQEKGIRFRIEDGGNVIADGIGRVIAAPIRASALCEGLIVHVDAKEGGDVLLSVYLDP